MSEPSLAELEAERERLYAQLSRVGDFRRGQGARTGGSAGSRTARARPRGTRVTVRGCC